MKTISSILSPVTTEIVIDKSRFICQLQPVNSVAEFQNSLHEIQQLHPKASHHCYAYIIGISGETQKFSDDGEPSGTAGMPILNILKHENLTNITSIVTRYFGGIKLGTGGLARAYSSATKAALEQAQIVIKSEMQLCQLIVNYSIADKIKYFLQSHAKIKAIDYTENVIFYFYLEPEKVAGITIEISNILNGQANLAFLGTEYI